MTQRDDRDEAIAWFIATINQSNVDNRSAGDGLKRKRPAHTSTPGTAAAPPDRTTPLNPIPSLPLRKVSPDSEGKPPRKIRLMGDKKIARMGTRGATGWSMQTNPPVVREEVFAKNQYVPTNRRQSREVSESMAELMRPLLLQWIDNQMPVIVEKALQREANANTDKPGVSSPSVPLKPSQGTTVYAQAPAVERKAERVRQVQTTRAVSEATAKALQPLMNHWLADNMPTRAEKFGPKEMDKSDKDLDLRNPTKNQSSPE